MILLYEVEHLPGWPALQAAMAIKKQTWRLVQPDEYHLTLGELAAGVSAGPSLPGAPLPEPMMVLCGLQGPALSQFLDLMRSMGAPSIALKAMLTPVNQNWNSRQLYQELRQEHEYFKGKQP